MAILRITKDNWELFCDELIDLSDEFLQLVCHQNPRTATASREVLAAMVATSNTVVLLCQDDSGVGIGISYFNFGSGYSCGGRYLWINCIYIRSGFRQQGWHPNARSDRAGGQAARDHPDGLFARPRERRFAPAACACRFPARGPGRGNEADRLRW